MEHAWEGLENEDTQARHLTLNDGEEVSDGGKGARGRCLPAEALGDGANHLLQPVIR